MWTIKNLVIKVCFVGLLFASCNNDVFDEPGDLQISSLEQNEKNLPKEVGDLRKSISEKFLKVRDFSELKTRNADADIDVSNELREVKVKTIQLLKSYGFSEEDWKEFNGENDSRLALAGVLFLGFLESNPKVAIRSKFDIPRTKSGSEGGDDGTCFDPYKILDCVLQATGVKYAIDAFLGKCITKAIAWGLCKTAASKLAGPVAVAIAIGDFAHCMGWFDDIL